MRKYFVLMLTLLFALSACDLGNTGSDTSQNIPDNAIIISIIYAPESDDYMQQFIPAFNQSYRDGINPVTGERLQSGEKPIHVDFVLLVVLLVEPIAALIPQD